MFPHHPRRPMNESRAHRERACTSTCLLALLLEGVGGLSSSVCVESVHVLIHVCWPYCLRELEAVCIRTGQLALSSTLRDCLCASEAVTRGCIVARCVCARLVVCETNGRATFPFGSGPLTGSARTLTRLSTAHYCTVSPFPMLLHTSAAFKSSLETR
jgi:hypothetical protein